MFLNALNMRLALIATGILLVGAYLLMGGSLGASPIVSIEFGTDPQQFEGLEVEIDGQVVGKLKMFGQATRSGFEVSKGIHSVRVLHPQLSCEPARVATELEGQKVMLLLEYQDTYDPRGGSKPGLILR